MLRYFEMGGTVRRALSVVKKRSGQHEHTIREFRLSSAGINIDGYSEMNGVVHVLTTDLPATRRVLDDAGFRIVQEQQVVLVPVEDEPGAAAKVFQRIAEAHVNVRYSYLATRNRLVISSDNPQALVIALSK